MEWFIQNKVSKSWYMTSFLLTPILFPILFRAINKCFFLQVNQLSVCLYKYPV